MPKLQLSTYFDADEVNVQLCNIKRHCTVIPANELHL